MLIAFAGWSFATILFITVIAILFDVAVRISASYRRIQREMNLGDQSMNQSQTVRLRPPAMRLGQQRKTVQQTVPAQRVAA